MKTHPCRLIFSLTLLVGLACFALFTARLVQSAAVLPHFNLPHIALLCLAARLLTHLLAPQRTPTPTAAPLAAVVFGVLPLCARLVTPDFALRLGLAGGAVMLVTDFLFTAAADRLASAKATPLALPAAALLLFLAMQAFTAVWL